jgi:hypothetical protein
MVRIIYCINWDEPVLPIEAGALPISRLERIVERGGVLLWNHKGLGGLISLPVLTNARDLYRDSRSARSQDEPPDVEIHWDQVIVLPKRVSDTLYGI